VAPVKKKDFEFSLEGEEPAGVNSAGNRSSLSFLWAGKYYTFDLDIRERRRGFNPLGRSYHQKTVPVDPQKRGRLPDLSIATAKRGKKLVAIPTIYNAARAAQGRVTWGGGL